jgi:very-short-patch-repair endonuclease
MKRRGTDIARKLRRNQTDAERLLWRRLRDRGLVNTKFRRQTPISGYIADFVCEDAKLIIEVDGGQHAESEGDAERTAILEAAGYTVLRFWNNDVLTNPDGVLLRIAEMLQITGQVPSPHPVPLPRERGPEATG